MSQRKDVFGLIQEFERMVLRHKPPVGVMKDEVRMMHFKVRPVSGDIAQLDMASDTFVEALWCMGKLEELYIKHVAHYPHTEQEVFSRFARSLQTNYARQLQQVFGAHKDPTTPNLEIEVFRDASSRRHVH